MNEKEIQDIILKYYYPTGKKIANTNYTGIGLEECDVIMIQKDSLFVYEYEIKISRSDFKADFKKNKHKQYGRSEQMPNKWSGYPLVPNYLHYVVPRDLIKAEEVPAYAGLIYIDSAGWPEVIKKAPRVHSHKASNNLIMSMIQNLTSKLVYGCSYMNYQRKQRESQLLDMESLELKRAA